MRARTRAALSLGVAVACALPTTVAAATEGMVMVGVTAEVVAAEGMAAEGMAQRAKPAPYSPADPAAWWYHVPKFSQWHAKGITGKGVTVALIDGAVATSLPEFADATVIPSGSICPLERGETPAQDAVLEPRDSVEGEEHPTAMASILVGSGRGNGPGGVGIPGIAPDVTLRVYKLFEDNEYCGGRDDRTVRMIRQAVADGADIIAVPNTSGSSVQEEVNRAVVKGVIVVTGVGNSMFNPLANFHGVVSAAGLTPEGKPDPRLPATIWDGTPDPLDPPAYVPSVAVPSEQFRALGLTNGRWDSTKVLAGTSMSTMWLAGVLALAKQRWPEASSNQLLQALILTANKGKPAYSPQFGFGAASVATLLTEDPTQRPDIHPAFGDYAKVVAGQDRSMYVQTVLSTDGSIYGPTWQATRPQVLIPAHLTHPTLWILSEPEWKVLNVPEPTYDERSLTGSAS